MYNSSNLSSPSSVQEVKSCWGGGCYYLKTWWVMRVYFEKWNWILFLLFLNHNKIFLTIVCCCGHVLWTRPGKDCEIWKTLVLQQLTVTWVFSWTSTGWSLPPWTWPASCSAPGWKTSGTSSTSPASSSLAHAHLSPEEKPSQAFG